MKPIPVSDLELYSQCPRLFRHYKDQKESPTETVYDKVREIALYAAFLKVLNKYSLNRIERAAESKIKFKKLHPTVAHNIWLAIRYYLIELDKLDLKMVNLPIRYQLNGRLLTTQTDIICSDRLVFIDTGPSYLIRTNLRYMMLLSYMYEHYSVSEATVLTSTCEGKQIQKQSLSVEDFNLEQFDADLYNLAHATQKGPFQPLYRCALKDCINRKGCNF